MAAAEYFNGPRPSAPYLAPQQSQRPPSTQYIPQNYSNTPPFPSPQPRPTTPQYQPPPPYGDEPKPHIQFPAELPARHSFSGQRPSPQQWQQPHAPTNPYSTQLQPYRPQGHLHPYYNQETAMTGYSSDPEKHHKRKSRDRSRKRRTSEAATPRSRSTNADGFIGAAGGGLIGDLIFPGLGTAAGAIAGWIGGKDYGKHRKGREERRDREQEKWEMKYGPREHSDSPKRSRDHSRDERRRSHDDGRRRSHDDGRRRSHDERRGMEY